MRAIASFDAVNEAANSLILEGLEPTTLAVQERIGGGSFTTVKKHLLLWTEQRAKEAAATTMMPKELIGKAQELTRSLWAMAVAEAQLDTEKAKESAQAEVVALKMELSEAIGEIARLEGIETELTESSIASKERLRDAELALREAQTTAAQVSKLEQELSEARATIKAAYTELTKKAEETGVLSGELEAAREQLRELKAELKK